MKFARCLVPMLVLFLLRPVGANAQTYGWSQLAAAPSGTTPRFDDIYFVNASLGWTVRSSNIFKTTNGGLTWILKTNSPATHFRSIGFTSINRGWAGNLGPGSYDTVASDTNVFYETFDGGETWSVVPGFNETGMKGFCALHILDSQHLYGAGRVRGPAYFASSTNGGTAWTVKNLTAAGVMGGIMDVYFKNPLEGWVVGMDTNAYNISCSPTYHGRIARTTDGGKTWVPQVTTSVGCCYFWKMSWPTPDIGYASLQRNSTAASIIFYKTTDGGATWVSNNIPLSVVGGNQFYCQGIGFVSKDEGWLGGDSSGTPYTTNLLHTIDGGVTWTRAGYNNSIRFNRIRFLSPVLGYAAAARLHVFRAPLAITATPQDQTAIAGSNVTLSVTAIGDPTITYAWRKDGINIPAATNTTITLTNVSRAQAGLYSVLVTNAGATLVTTNARLRVLVPQELQPPVPLPGTPAARIIFSDADGGMITSNDLAFLEFQASSDLMSWIAVTNKLTLTNGAVQVEDSRQLPFRFYRVLSR